MGRVMTLLYHRVRSYDQDIQLLAVTPEHFAGHMRWLKENYKIVRFDEDWNQMNEDAVCITFDDGYRDNFLNAVPILNELQIPATIFVSTGNIDTERELWWDELERNLLVDKKYGKTFSLSDKMFECTWDVSTSDRRMDLYSTMHWLMRLINTERREDWIRQMQKWNGYTESGRKENQSVRTEDLKGIDLSQILIGAHTVNHPVLSQLSRDEQRKEIVMSQKKLESILKIPIQTFSYPFGTTADYNKDTICICKEADIVKVAANVRGIWEPGNDLFQVPRHIVRDWELELFKRKIEMFWEGK